MSTKNISTEIISTKIFFFRGQRVMLDRDLAELYAVETRALNQAVHRNKERFPSDFCFQLSESEVKTLVSQFVIPSKVGHDLAIQQVFEAIRKLMNPQETPRERIGFHGK